jgi:hypothetical protein
MGVERIVLLPETPGVIVRLGKSGLVPEDENDRFGTRDQVLDKPAVQSVRDVAVRNAVAPAVVVLVQNNEVSVPVVEVVGRFLAPGRASANDVRERRTVRVE